MIDAHQHFWQLSRGDYPWPNETVAPIFRDFSPEDLFPLLDKVGVEKTVLVQATDTVAETEFLLEIARKTDRVAGVIGWVDLSAHDAITTIDRLRADPKLKGLRPMLQNIEDTAWIIQEAVQPTLRHMAKTGLRFDALIQPRHLPYLLEIATKHTELMIIIDHAAKPNMKQDKPDGSWLTGMSKLAACTNVWCKLSGMLTEIGPQWQNDDLTAFAAHILLEFGSEKVLWGSDWPVLNLASDYETWFKTSKKLIAHLPEEEQRSILGVNATEFYGLL